MRWEQVWKRQHEITCQVQHNQNYLIAAGT